MVNSKNSEINNSPFKMDRNTFSMGKMNEKSEVHDYTNLSEKEQRKVSSYLISIAYGFVNKPWPKMDKTKFEIVKR